MYSILLEGAKMGVKFGVAAIVGIAMVEVASRAAEKGEQLAGDGIDLAKKKIAERRAAKTQS